MTRATIAPHVERVLSKLQNVTERAGGWRALCPAHDDHHPSLDIAIGDDQRVLFTCRSRACDASSIVSAIGISMSDLFVDSNRNGRPEAPRRDAKPHRKGEPMTLQTALAACGRIGTVGGHWIYTDGAGKPVLLTVRIETAEGKSFRQLRASGDRWAWGSPEGLRPIFNLPALLADSKREVLVVEGERCVDDLVRLGLLGVTSAGGSKGAKRTDWSPLAGRDVAILPDYDKPGVAYADEVAAHLRGLGCRVRIVELPALLCDGERVDDLRDGDDVADLIARRRARGLDDGDIGEQIAKCVEAAPAAEETAASGPTVTEWPESSLDELMGRPPLEWLVESLVPERSVVVLAGHPGAGKSFLALDLACRLTHGMCEWMGEAITGHGPVAYLALEGGAGLAGRVRAWRVHHSAEQPQHPLQLIEPDDDVAPLSIEGVGTTRRRLRQWAERHGKPVLVVIDTATLAVDGDENDAATWRAALRCAAQIATEHGCAVLLVHHLRKQVQGKPEPLSLASVRGSGATGGNVDHVLGAEKVDDSADRRLVCLKAKDGIEPPAHGYALDVVHTGMRRRNGREETSCVVRSLGAARAAQVDPEAQQLAEALARHTETEARVEAAVAALRALGGSTSSRRAITNEMGGKWTLANAAVSLAIDRGRIVEKGARDSRRYTLPEAE